MGASRWRALHIVAASNLIDTKLTLNLLQRAQVTAWQAPSTCSMAFKLCLAWLQCPICTALLKQHCRAH